MQEKKFDLRLLTHKYTLEEVIHNKELRKLIPHFVRDGSLKAKKKDKPNGCIIDPYKLTRVQKLQQLVSLADDLIRETDELHPYETSIGDRYKVSIGDRFIYIEDKAKKQIVDGPYDNSAIFGIKPTPVVYCSHESVYAFFTSLGNEVCRLYNAGVDQASIDEIIREELTYAAEEFKQRGVKFFPPDQIEHFGISFDYDEPFRKAIRIIVPKHVQDSVAGVLINGVDISKVAGFTIHLW